MGRRRRRKKIAWVSWKSICLKREQDGLGLKDIVLFNEVLLAK